MVKDRHNETHTKLAQGAFGYGTFVMDAWQYIAVGFTTVVMLNGCAPSQVSEFDTALACVEAGWNSGNARMASSCFTEDAIYMEPGQKQYYVGREALFEFFGGETGRDNAMTMTWHDRAYNEKTGVGFAEFSFYYGSYAHGVVRLQIEDGKISNWREYWYESLDDWDKFLRPMTDKTGKQQ